MSSLPQFQPPKKTQKDPTARPQTVPEVPPFFALEIFQQAEERTRRGEDIIRLEAGQPQTGAPQAVVAAAQHELATSILPYTPAVGTTSLREAVAQHYASYYGCTIDPQRVMITTGSTAALSLAVLATTVPGDEVLLATPCYPGIRNALLALGRRPFLLPTPKTTRFQPTPALLAAHPEARAVIVTSPGNPTGSLLTPKEQQALVTACAAQGLHLIADEIYHGITYARAATTLAGLSSQAIVTSGFSKYFGMTGWRLGWMIWPQALYPLAARLAANLYVAPPTLAQAAAGVAFGCRQELDARVAAYAANRALLLDALPALRLPPVIIPEGAFYAYIDASAHGSDSLTLCRMMLDEIGVAMAPGVDFDPENGGCTLRLSFAGAQQDIRRALERLSSWPQLHKK